MWNYYTITKIDSGKLNMYVVYSKVTTKNNNKKNQIDYN